MFTFSSHCPPKPTKSTPLFRLSPTQAPSRLCIERRWCHPIQSILSIACHFRSFTRHLSLVTLNTITKIFIFSPHRTFLLLFSTLHLIFPLHFFAQGFVGSFRLGSLFFSRDHLDFLNASLTFTSLVVPQNRDIVEVRLLNASFA